jgi:hypothetical protein
MAELIPSDSSNQIEFKRNNDNLNHYEPRLEDIADLRPWGTKKYDKAGGFADVSARDANRSQKKTTCIPAPKTNFPSWPFLGVCLSRDILFVPTPS